MKQILVVLVAVITSWIVPGIQAQESRQSTTLSTEQEVWLEPAERHERNGWIATDFLAAHPQYSWMKGLLKDRPTEVWTVFTAGEEATE